MTVQQYGYEFGVFLVFFARVARYTFSSVNYEVVVKA